MNNNNREPTLWVELAKAVVDMDEKKVIELSNEVLDSSFSPKLAIVNGLSKGMDEVGEKFASEIYFVPEVLICADTMYAGFNILKRHIKECEIKKDVTIVIGVVEGDFHDIGKNIVALMLEAAGFIVYDLGYNVPTIKFIEKIKKVNPDIIALSTLMTTTLEKMEEIIKFVRSEFMDCSPKIMIGGAPVTKMFSDKINADFYGEDAYQAVKGVKNLTGIL